MNDQAESSSFGALLRQQRLAAGFTQAALAERAGVSERTIQRGWEKGRLYLHHAIDAASSAVGTA